MLGRSMLPSQDVTMSYAPSEPTSSPCIATAIREASRRMTQWFDEMLAPAGLRSTQFTILLELSRRSGRASTIGELAAAIVMDRSSLGHTLRPLERDGLVAMSDGEDKRRREVILTPTGADLLERARPHWQTAQDRFAEVYGDNTMSDLRATMRRIARDPRLTIEE